MKINEVFTSIQGEGANTGFPTTFVRFQGCNLVPGCVWCDTKYARRSGGQELSIADVVSKIKTPDVCITGGEPLSHYDDLTDLVVVLLENNRDVEIFTNGTLPPPVWVDEVQWCVDIKCPSAKVRKHSLVSEWVSVLAPTDVIKFVVGTEQDLMFVKKTLPSLTSFLGDVVISPMILGDVFVETSWLKIVWDFCIKHDARFGLQLHKVIFGNKRGV